VQIIRLRRKIAKHELCQKSRGEGKPGAKISLVRNARFDDGEGLLEEFVANGNQGDTRSLFLIPVLGKHPAS